MVYKIILFLALSIILSYFLTGLSKRIHIPSVLMLIASGFIFQKIVEKMALNIPISNEILQFIGTVGLIMIVLEGALDLKLSTEKIPMIKKSLMMAMTVLIFSILFMTGAIKLFTKATWINSIIHAIPLSIISSAIVIPSVSKLDQGHKEFLIFESSFSDILGILLFNYFVYQDRISLVSFAGYTLNFSLTVLGAILIGFMLLLMLEKAKTNELNNLLILSILVAVYAIGKLYHISALIVVLVLGLVFNNYREISTGVLISLNRYRPLKKIPNIDISEFKHVCVEITFVIRTIFFMLIGFTLNASIFRRWSVILPALMIIAIIYGVRYFSLKYIVKDRVMPHIFFAPRGLITILLYYAIPARFQIDGFDEGILFFTMIVTSFIMVLGSCSPIQKWITPTQEAK